MSRHQWTIVVEVDDEKLKTHDGSKSPPPNDVDEWVASDLWHAHRLGIVDLRDVEFLGDAEVR